MLVNLQNSWLRQRTFSSIKPKHKTNDNVVQLDDAQNSQWADRPHMHWMRYMENKEDEKPTESTGRVLAEDFPMVKLKIVKSLGTQ